MLMTFPPTPGLNTSAVHGAPVADLHQVQRLTRKLKHRPMTCISADRRARTGSSMISSLPSRSSTKYRGKGWAMAAKEAGFGSK